jgi:hypothetical protein
MDGDLGHLRGPSPPSGFRELWTRSSLPSITLVNRIKTEIFTSDKDQRETIKSFAETGDI